LLFFSCVSFLFLSGSVLRVLFLFISPLAPLLASLSLLPTPHERYPCVSFDAVLSSLSRQTNLLFLFFQNCLLQSAGTFALSKHAQTSCPLISASARATIPFFFCRPSFHGLLFPLLIQTLPIFCSLRRSPDCSNSPSLGGGLRGGPLEKLLGGQKFFF